MTIAEQTAKLVESLPPEKAETVLEFARFLAEKTAEEEWDRRLDSAHQSPRFRAVVDDVERRIAQGEATPLDPTEL